VIENILRELVNGKEPTRNEALLLSEAQGEELHALLAAAAELRDRCKGKVVTFSPKIFVPLTNLCRDFCGYCTFRKAPDEPGAKTMTIAEVLRVVHQGKVLGCTEVLFSLGDKPEAIYPQMKEFLAREGYQRTLSYLYEACRAVLEETDLLPHSNPGVMGRADLRQLKEVNVSMGLMLENRANGSCWQAGRTSMRRTKSPQFGCAPWKKPASSAFPSRRVFSSASVKHGSKELILCLLSGT